MQAQDRELFISTIFQRSQQFTRPKESIEVKGAHDR